MKIGMRNKEVAQVLEEIGYRLEIDGKEPRFKIQAYARAARTIEGLAQAIEEIAANKKLEDIEGIGSSIAKKIEEILTTGTCKKLEELRKQVPLDVQGLMSIEGLGPKKIKTLYQKLKIKNVDDLKKAAQEHKIRELEGFGEKSEQDILANIEYSLGNRRFYLAEAEAVAEPLVAALRKLPGVEQFEVAGSIRRKKITIGDIDILCVAQNPDAVMDSFVSLPQVREILSKGHTRSSVRLKNHIETDIRVIPKKSWGAALNYFTGSKEHNVELRRIAKRKGWKLNEYGLFDNNEKFIAGRTEEELYHKLGLEYVAPEQRETTESIKALKKKGKLTHTSRSQSQLRYAV